MQQATFGNVCAILDVFGSYHDAPAGITTGELGGREMPAYNAYYADYSSKFKTFGTIADSLSLYNSCGLHTST